MECLASVFSTEAAAQHLAVQLETFKGRKLDHETLDEIRQRLNAHLARKP